MEVILTGYFTEINNDNNMNFEPNAIAILYPYVRAIVSTYTASANITPLLLPAINVNKLIEEQNKGWNHCESIHAHTNSLVNKKINIKK